MNARLSLPLLIAALVLCGCSTLFRSVVTTTEVVDAAMQAWADLSVRGQTTGALDARVRVAHANYQKAASIARDALKVYRDTGDKGSYEQALAATQATMLGLLDIITPLLLPEKATELKAKAGKAKVL